MLDEGDCAFKVWDDARSQYLCKANKVLREALRGNHTASLLHIREVNIEELKERDIGEVLTFFVQEYLRKNLDGSFSLIHFGKPYVWIIPGGFGWDQRLVEGTHHYLVELFSRNLAPCPLEIL